MTPDWRNNCLSLWIRNRMLAHPMWNAVAHRFVIFITQNPNAWLK